MEIIYFNNIEEMMWDNYVRQVKNYTFNYLSSRIKFDVVFSEKVAFNESFLIREGLETVAVVPLFIELAESESEYSISLSGGYQWAPLIALNKSYRIQEQWLEKIGMIIKEKMSEYNCKFVKMRIDPMSNPAMNQLMSNHNYLLELGFEDHSILSRMVCLEKNDELIFSEFRKNHQRCIKKSSKFYEYEIIDAKNVSRIEFKDFYDIYVKAAGFIPKSMLFTEHYYNWIKNDLAILVYTNFNGKRIGAILCMYANDSAYYGFGAELDGFEGVAPIGHGMQYEAMKYFKQRGIHYYEVGWQQYAMLSYDKPSEKEMNISFFKRGFGGYNVPLYRGYLVNREDGQCNLV